MSKHLHIRIALGVILAGILTWPAQAQSDQTFCWKRSKGRGVGGTPNSCPSGSEMQAGLCYPSCPSGYVGVGPVCWQSCPSGFSDIGVGCQKPSATSSPGYAWQGGDGLNLDGARSRCQAANRYGCYQSGLLYFPNCAPNFHKVGDNICSPDCPAGMYDTGANCTKGTSTRGAGQVPSCGSGMDTDAGLCYPACGQGYDGVGPMCWGQCPSDHPAQCGAACAISDAACAKAVGDMTLNTVAVALNMLSFVYGGPGVSTALKEAAGAGERGVLDSVLTHAPEAGESLLFNVVKDYSRNYGKQFAKTMLRNQFDDANLFWRSVKLANTTALTTINKATAEFGVSQDAHAFDLTSLASLDPTGITTMVLSFTKYGPCSSDEDFVVDQDEVNFTAPGGTANITVTAQNPVTITRVTSPGLTGCSITPTADCIGKKLQPGDTCHISANVTATGPLDSELRIYTSAYTSVPYPIHIQSRGGSGPRCKSDPAVEEAVNLTSIAGAWAFADDQTKKVVIQSDGQVQAPAGSGTVTVKGLSGRAFQFNVGNVTSVFTLDGNGDHMSGAPFPDVITVKSSGKVLDVTGASTADNVPLEQWDYNQGANQVFAFLPQDDGTYEIQNALSQKALRVTGPADGTGRIVQTTWNGDITQRFRIEPVGDEKDGYYKILSVYSGKVLTVANNSTDNGAEIRQSDWAGGDNQTFKLTQGQYMLRRPWDSGCPAGEALFDGLCYDVPAGYAMTTPGVMGRLCPTDWRDDGTACWPPWTGVSVASQADPNGSDAMRHPLVVTDCSNYSAANNQSCPANYSGPIGCSCQPQTKSKGIQSIAGTVPNN